MSSRDARLEPVAKMGENSGAISLVAIREEQRHTIGGTSKAT
jgi:hypothetical protein